MKKRKINSIYYISLFILFLFGYLLMKNGGPRAIPAMLMSSLVSYK